MNKAKDYFAYRNNLILDDYKKLEITVENIAKKYDITVRTVQRIVKKLGFIRTVAEANKKAACLKDYSGHRLPEELKKKRKTLPRNIRYTLIKNHPFCSICGNTMQQCPLHIDHIDGDATNNDLSNLQVLCLLCNHGKARDENNQFKKVL